MHVGAGEYLAVFAFVLLGGLVQGSLGFGLSLVCVPIIAAVAPEALPAGAILISLPLAVAMAWLEREHIDRPGVGWIFVGRIPGTVAAVVVVAALSARLVGGLAGALVVLAALISLRVRPHEVERRSAIVAGTASGFMGTAASVDGPPLALLYQHHEPGAIRATLAASFTLGTLLSVGALAAAGAVEGWQVVFAVAQMPALGLGLLTAQVLRPRIAGRSFRPAVLVFAAFAGVAAVGRAALGA